MHDIDLIVAESKASQNKTELRKVLQYVGEIKPKVVVEIGVHQGYSLVDWYKAFVPDIIVGIDNDLHALDVEATKHMHIIDGDSHSIETKNRLQGILAGRSIDFLYLDGDHTYEGVKQDYEMYSPLVRSGGIIGFDDIRLNSNEWRMNGVDVNRFWVQLIGHSGSKYLEFWDEAQLSGFGTGDGIYYKP